MTSDQKYDGKDSLANNVDQTVGNTDLTVKSDDQTFSHEDGRLKFPTSLRELNDQASETETVFWALDNAKIDLLFEIQSEFDDNGNDELSGKIDSILKHETIQSNLVAALFSHVADLLEKNDRASTHRRNADLSYQATENVQAAEINGLKQNIQTLENELAFYQKLTLAQADIIGKAGLANSAVQATTSVTGNAGEGQANV